MLRFGTFLTGFVAASVLATASVHAQDSDADGVADAADAFPCDPAVTGEAFAPAQGQRGLLLFEDEFPSGGDYDFNDVVVAHNVAAQLDAQQRVVSMRMNLALLAAGGGRASGLRLHLPVDRSLVARVDRTVGQVTAEVPLWPDTEATLDVAADLTALFGAGGPVNVQQGQPAVAPVVITLEFTFATPVALSLTDAPFDLFMFDTTYEGREVHRSAYAGSSRMDGGLFNTGADASAPGRWFVDDRGVPFVLELPEVVAHPAELTDIAQLYPDLLSWASSGGATHPDFYRTNVDSTFASPTVAAPSVSPSGYPVDDTCIDPYVPGSQWFEYTGGPQTFVVPSGVTSIDVILYGARGGGAGGIRAPGVGGAVTAQVPVSAGDTVYVYVGGEGGRPAGGYNGGGSGNGSSSLSSGGGGGGTDIRVGGNALADRVLVAGGGGGGGAGPGSTLQGGAGGGTTGRNGNTTDAGSGPGLGGTQTAGGSGGDGQFGNWQNRGGGGGFGVGGRGGAYNSYPNGGGGGGGWYGGGGGGVRACCGSGGAGGGGGSGYSAPANVGTRWLGTSPYAHGRALIVW